MRNQCSYIANESLKIKIRSLSYFRFPDFELHFPNLFGKMKGSKKDS